MHSKSALLLELKLPHICNDIMICHHYNCYSFVLLHAVTCINCTGFLDVLYCLSATAFKKL